MLAYRSYSRAVLLRNDTALLRNHREKLMGIGHRGISECGVRRTCPRFVIQARLLYVVYSYIVDFCVPSHLHTVGQYCGIYLVAIIDTTLAEVHRRAKWQEGKDLEEYQ